MKPTLKEFTVWIPTKLDMGIIKVKAKDFKDAFRRLGKKDKAKDGYIEDEQGDSVAFNEILGCHENQQS